MGSTGFIWRAYLSGHPTHVRHQWRQLCRSRGVWSVKSQSHYRRRLAAIQNRRISTIRQKCINGEFRDVLFYRDDIEANLEREYRPGN